MAFQPCSHDCINCTKDMRARQDSRSTIAMVGGGSIQHAGLGIVHCRGVRTGKGRDLLHSELIGYIVIQTLWVNPSGRLAGILAEYGTSVCEIVRPFWHRQLFDRTRPVGQTGHLQIVEGIRDAGLRLSVPCFVSALGFSGFEK